MRVWVAALMAGALCVVANATATARVKQGEQLNLKSLSSYDCAVLGEDFANLTLSDGFVESTAIEVLWRGECLVSQLEEKIRIHASQWQSKNFHSARTLFLVHAHGLGVPQDYERAFGFLRGPSDRATADVSPDSDATKGYVHAVVMRFHSLYNLRLRHEIDHEAKITLSVDTKESAEQWIGSIRTAWIGRFAGLAGERRLRERLVNLMQMAVQEVPQVNTERLQPYKMDVQFRQEAPEDVPRLPGKALPGTRRW